MKAFVVAAILVAAPLFVGCGPSVAQTPLPGGLPPEYEAPRPFPSGTPGAPNAAAPVAAPSAAPVAPK